MAGAGSWLRLIYDELKQSSGSSGPTEVSGPNEGPVQVEGPDGNPVPVAPPQVAAPTDHSGTITTGGASQQLMPANSSRQGFWIQNVSDDALWINELQSANADQPSLMIPTGEYYETSSVVPTGAISIIGPTTGQSFSAREW